ncbi:sensor histidine kinase [Streptomyces canus]|uniref:sensor histidine kinase n=1 Tax=Streptomyces canus TaxID=58343 RepID=UPI0036BD83B9
MKSVSARGCAGGAGTGALFAAVFVDVAYSTGGDGPSWPLAATLLLGGVAVLWPAARHPRRLTPQLRTAVPAVASLACTVDSVARSGALFGPGELAILLCLLFIAVRHCPRNWVVACAALDGAAVLALPVRPFPAEQDTMLGFMLIGLLLVGLTIAFAAYLRSQDYRRTVAVSETRRAERLAIAADLHDFVAHHVTGILVQTQVARMMADTGAEELDPVLAGIERAATEALASMRRTVGVLRDTDDAADRRPVGDLAGIAGLIEGFASPVQKATLHHETAVPDLPHEVQAAAFRVVQEALTNVRRHAGDATHVTVGLRYERDRLRVSVSDDGRGGSQLPAAAHGGGFGLVGLKERVTALGGELDAGPRAEYGWEVRAVFPG